MPTKGDAHIARAAAPGMLLPRLADTNHFGKQLIEVRDWLKFEIPSGLGVGPHGMFRPTKDSGNTVVPMNFVQYIGSLYA
jgi:hypothetical protein